MSFHSEKKIVLWAQSFFLFYFLLVFFPNTFADEFTIVQVAEGIYVHPGKQVGFEHPERDDIANIGFIVGENCVAVIDTGGSIKTGRRLYASVKKITSKPICYVINTHVHFDHILGNHVFGKKHVKFIGHSQLENSLLSSRSFFIEQFSNELGENLTEDMLAPPNISVTDNLEVDLGNRKLLIQAYQPAHSHTDITVFDKKTDTLWLSDLLFVDHIPVLDGNLRGWLEVMAKINATEPTHIIPGHGKIDLHWHEAITPQYHYLTLLLNETLTQIRQGHFMEEAIAVVGKEEKLKWKLYEQHHKRNVTKAFTELEWE